MTPYLSVVVAARNDNHGDNMLGRMQAFLDCWIAQAQRYNLPSEIIIVEWNPPAGKPRLIDDLRWPAHMQLCEVRFVEVPAEIHQQFPNAATIPLHQMIAKNAGIRRARGQFVLVTNIDIIFSAELMQFLASRQLEQGVMYRIDRLDVARDIPAGASVDEMLAFCQSHILRVFALEGGFNLDAGLLPVRNPHEIFAVETGIRIGKGWHDVEFSSYRWVEEEAELLFQRPRTAAPRLLIDAEAGPSAGSSPVTLEVLDEAGSVLAGATFTGRRILRLHMPSEISTARLFLRTRGQGLPLMLDPRVLNLRVLGMEWEPIPEWLVSGAVPPENPGGVEPAVRVLTTGERQVQFAVRTRPGASLDRIDVELRGAAGELIGAVPITAASSEAGEHLVTMHLQFGYAGGAPPPEPTPWLLEAIGEKATLPWNLAYHGVNPLSSQIHHTAYLHANTCGDLTLLSRDDWFAMRGYAEFPIWPMHVDGLFCYAAYHAGIRQQILREPLRLFHIEHSSGAGWTPEGEQERLARLQAKGLNEMLFDEVAVWINHMRKFDAPIIFTLGNWGLGDTDLKEAKVEPTGERAART